MAFGRLLLAIVAGYAIFVVAALALFSGTGHDPHAAQPMIFMILAVAVGMLSAAAGGYVSALVYGQPKITAPRGLAFLIAIFAAVSLVTSRGAGWSQWSAMLFMAPAALAGGVLWLKRRG
ncbi:MAG: hypothetical protein ABIY52_01430 [Gemmatimonadaceae bacterium]